MKQYLDLLKVIKEKGTHKPAARAGMPGTTSLFGYQFRHNLADGFPLLTTKKIHWKSVVTELIWFLRGDTNIKYLVYNGVNIWNEDAYNYYVKIASQNTVDSARGLYIHHSHDDCRMFTFDEFIHIIKSCEKVDCEGDIMKLPSCSGYTLGDCGYQYGRVWRKWHTISYLKNANEIINNGGTGLESITVDQIKNLINGLRNNPEGRRHIVTAIDPAHDQDLALYWCHAMFQFNCRPLTIDQRLKFVDDSNCRADLEVKESTLRTEDEILNEYNIPKYYLDCQLYQRSADVVLGVPFNIASYALLTHIIAKMCNMIPGEFIHTFGDVHIYDDHMEAVDEQLKREERSLPTLKIMLIDLHDCDLNYLLGEFLEKTNYEDYILVNYNPHPAIKAKLSTGLK